jgi:hypothetical protein
MLMFVLCKCETLSTARDMLSAKCAITRNRGSCNVSKREHAPSHVRPEDAGTPAAEPKQQEDCVRLKDRQGPGIIRSSCAPAHLHRAGKLVPAREHLVSTAEACGEVKSQRTGTNVRMYSPSGSACACA